MEKEASKSQNEALEQSPVHSKDKDVVTDGSISELRERIDKLRVKMDPLVQKERLESAHKVFKEPAFHEIINELIDRQINHSINKAEDWERVMFDRAVINGLELMKEEFEKLNSQYLEMVEPIETFNKHEITSN